MPQVKLTHHCRKPSCVGNNGDVIEVSEEDLRFLLERKGAILIDAAGEPVVAESESGDEAPERQAGEGRNKPHLRDTLASMGVPDAAIAELAEGGVMTVQELAQWSQMNELTILADVGKATARKILDALKQ